MTRGTFIWPDQRSREVLPIDSYLEEILGLLEHHQVVVVEAETGAGKTTRIGQAVVLANPRQRAIMTLPRRNAVRWNGKRIACEMGCEPGELVGWRLFGEDPTVSRMTRLELRVDQSLANQIRRNEGRLPERLIIVDEAHERSVSTDLLLGLLREGLESSPETRVLITSATIDTRKFSNFFALGGTPAPIVNVPGRCYPVSTEVVRLARYEHHSEGAGRAGVLCMERFLKGDLSTPASSGEGTQTVSKGTVIVLLAGKEDIRNVAGSLQREARRLQDLPEGELGVFEVLEVHGESTPDEQDRVQRPVPEGVLRFVCGTEILRSSVTVRDTVGVIDTLDVKRLTTNAEGVGHLEKIAVSRAEADQAKGRAGRTQPGFYMPISFERGYEGLALYPTPAILREPITHVALQVAGIDRSVRDFAFIDRPEVAKVESAITRLKRLGALDAEERITETGRFLVQFPTDPERAKALVTADRLEVLPEAVIVTAVLEKEGFFHPPKGDVKKVEVEEWLAREVLRRVEKKDRSYGGTEPRWEWEQIHSKSEWREAEQVSLDDMPKWCIRKGDVFELDCESYDFPFRNVRELADLVRKRWAGEGGSDFAAIVRAYRAFKTEETRLRSLTESREGHNVPLPRNARESKLRDWCMRNFINFKRLRMAEDGMAQIREELESSPLELRNGIARDRNFSAEDLTKALASGLIDNVARKGGALEFNGALGEFQLAYQSSCPRDSSLILVGGVRKIPGRSGRGRSTLIPLADLAAPLTPQMLHSVAPHLCTRRPQGDYHYDPKTDAVVEAVAIRFCDTEIGRVTETSEDATHPPTTFANWLADQMVK